MNLIIWAFIPIIVGFLFAMIYIAITSLGDYKCFRRNYSRIPTLEFYRLSESIISTDATIVYNTKNKIFILSEDDKICFLISSPPLLSTLNPIMYYWYRKYDKKLTKMFN